MSKKDTLPASELKNLKNPHGLNQPAVAALIEELTPLREVHLALKAIHYVIDGDEPQMLLELAGKKDALEAMAFAGSPANYKKIRARASDRGRMLAAVLNAPAELLMRLGEVYAAIRQPHGRVDFAPLLPGFPNWLLALLTEIAVVDQHHALKAWPLAVVENLLLQGGQPAGALVAPALDADFNTGITSVVGWSNTGWKHAFDGWGDYFGRHVDSVRQALQSNSSTDKKLFALDALFNAKAPLDGVLDLLVSMSCDTSKTVRGAVLQTLQSQVATRPELLETLEPLIERVLNDGDAGQRNEAAELLWRLSGPRARERLQQHADGESAQRVRQTIQRLLGTPDGSPPDESAPVLMPELPPVEIPVGPLPLPQAAKDDLRGYLQKKRDEAFKQYQAEMARYQAADPKDRHWKPREPVPIDDGEFQTLFDFVEGKSRKDLSNKLPYYCWGMPLPDSWTPPDVQLIHVVRLMSAMGILNVRSHDDTLWINGDMLEKYRARCQPKFGLRELDAVVATLPGGKAGMVPKSYLAGNNNYNSQFDWEPEAVWPAFMECRQVLHAALGPSPNRGRNYSSYDYSFGDKRRNAFRVLAMLPTLPTEFVPLLWDMALGDSKSDRIPAQNALATVDGKSERVLQSLQDGRQETRAAAADWLGRLNDPAAIEPLKAAFRKEKQEFAKGVYMAALESLGANVEEFLDRKKLLKEAEAGLAKKRPKGMDWFPVSAMPAVHWADTGKPVDPKILEWWVVQTVQQKSPTCGPLLRRYLQMCRPADTAALGKFVLSAWISEDTRHPTQEEAATKAGKEADQQFALHGNNSWFKDYWKDRDNLYRSLYQQYSEQFLGSAIGEKGMLALASVSGDSDCVKLCEQYLRKYFGHRLAQCKALIEVLAWMKHPLAIQLLLSIGSRFRTKALRQAANEHVQALAEREGWTIDELADRTIPDAGFARPTDEEGRPTGPVAELLLDYGPRSFVVKLDDDLEPVITRDDGKGVKAPPAPAKSDDAEKAKEAKKAFSEAKKLVKEVVKRQSERLYEALCTQRAWRFDDWQRYLAQHPIVGKICTRVVWSAFEPSRDGAPEQFRTNFRPLEDGSLTNEADESVQCADDTIVRVAHDCNTPAELRPRWIQHLQDYDVQPLFPQFGRAVFELPAAQGDTTEIKDFQGHLLTTFKLRGKANRLGWLRGEAEDGGCFMLYRKPFPSLQLQAVLEFTGSFLPEEDIPAALKGLSFEAIRNDREEASSWSRSAMPLKKIPPVLLSECYNDVRQIAAEGSGFDPEWEKKSYF